MTVPSILLTVCHALGLIVEVCPWVFLLIVIWDKMKNKQINYLESIFHAEVGNLGGEERGLLVRAVFRSVNIVSFLGVIF